MHSALSGKGWRRNPPRVFAERGKPLPAALPALRLLGLVGPTSLGPLFPSNLCGFGAVSASGVRKVVTSWVNRFCSRGSGRGRLTGYRLPLTREKLPVYISLGCSALPPRGRQVG